VVHDDFDAILLTIKKIALGLSVDGRLDFLCCLHVVVALEELIELADTLAQVIVVDTAIIVEIKTEPVLVDIHGDIGVGLADILD